jgi:hypothetical protein
LLRLLRDGLPIAGQRSVHLVDKDVDPILGYLVTI